MLILLLLWLQLLEGFPLGAVAEELQPARDAPFIQGGVVLVTPCFTESREL